MFVQVDVMVEDECRLLADHVVARFGKIDCLVNNAAMYLSVCLSIYPLGCLFHSLVEERERKRKWNMGK